MRQNPIEEQFRAAGIEAEVYGPSMVRNGIELDEWQLVIDGEVVVRSGGGHGTFVKAIEKWKTERSSKERSNDSQAS